MNKDPEKEFTFKREDDSLEDRHVHLEEDLSNYNYAFFVIEEILTLDHGLRHIKYLRSIDRSQMQEIAYQSIMAKFGLQEEDPTVLTTAEKQAVASDFELYVRYAFKCEFGFSFEMNWHHSYMCQLFQRLFLGTNKCPRVIINIPPRYSKTQMLLYWISWTMGHVPDASNILVGYSKMISENSSAQIREVMESEWYQSLFPTRLSKKSKAKDKFETTRRGLVFATSVGGTVTGFGAGRKRNSFGGAIIVDDGNKASDANSQTERDKTNQWYMGTLLSRRNNLKQTPIIMIQQRIHEEDLTGFLIPTKEKEKGETGEEYEHIVMPSIMTKEELDYYKVPEDSPSRLEGDVELDEYPLWHTKISLEELNSMKESYDSLTFFGQYQQVPFADGGDILKSEWIEEVETPDNKHKNYVIQTIDTAQTVKTRSDYSVIMTGWKLSNGKVYIHDLVRKKLKAPALVAETQKEFVKHKPRRLYIEFKSSGIGLCQTLAVGNIPMPIIKVKRDGGAGDSDKETRANGAATYLSNGWIVVRKGAPWVSDLFQEMNAFPNGKHDDMVDCLVEMTHQEIMPDGTFMHDMDVSAIPVKGSTYAQETEDQEEVESFYDVVEDLCPLGAETLATNEYSGYGENNGYSWEQGLYD